MSAPAPPPRFLVFAAMRDEGPFIVEWLCWYRMLGFEALVAINDCADHSPALLARLAEEGWVTVVEHRPAPGEPPKRSAHRAARRHPLVAAADWLLVCDVDEFLVLHDGGTVGAFLARTPGPFQGVCFHWQCFGTGGWRHWEDGLVHRQFTRCGAEREKPNRNVKTLVREPRRFRRLADHAPVGFDGSFGTGAQVFVDAEGRPIPAFGDLSEPLRLTGLDAVTHRRAQMNHYVLRSGESYDLKRGRPSASALKDRYTPAFFRRHDLGTHQDASAPAREADFAPLHAAAMALPGVRRLHHLCCMDYVARLCALAGRAPGEDPRWRHHRAEAERG